MMTAASPPGGPARRHLLVDIGGGSTELVLGRTEVAVSTSLDVGCVRLTERFLASDPPTPELAAAAAYVRSLLPELRGRHAIGVAGTVTTLATLDLGDRRVRPRANARSPDRARVGRARARPAGGADARGAAARPGDRARPRAR